MRARLGEAVREREKRVRRERACKRKVCREVRARRQHNEATLVEPQL